MPMGRKGKKPQHIVIDAPYTASADSSAGTKSKSYHRGYDCFTPDPGECKGYNCGACGAWMDVCRNTTGARSYAAAMGRIYSQYDRFTCHFTGNDWHDLLIKLKQEQKETASPTLKAILQRDIDKILQANWYAIASYEPIETTGGASKIH